MAKRDDAARHDAAASASVATAAGQSGPGWGVSYGFDRDVELPGDATIAAHAEAEPGWGATGGNGGGVREVGPFFDALDQAASAVDSLQELLVDRSVPVGDLAAATVRLHQLTCRVQATHLAALGQTVAAEALPEGSPTANSWIGVSHRIDSSRASKARSDATWLADHPRVAEALAAGVIGVDHVTVMRTISEANKTRRDAFADFEAAAIAAAMLTDPAGLRQIMSLWATAVDPDGADDDADKNYERRKLFVDPVGDRWFINGELPAEMGALLAGALNAYMDQLRDAYTNGDGVRVPTSARRADALIALVNAAIAANNKAADAAGAGTNGASTDAQLTLDTVEAADAGADAAPASDDDQRDTSNEDAAATPTCSDDPSHGRPETSDPSDPVDPSDPGDPFGPSDPFGPGGSGGSGGSGAVITLPPTAVTRAQVIVTVPITTLHTCPNCRRGDDPAASLTCILTSHHARAGGDGGASDGTEPHLGSDARDTLTDALATGATWAVGNGPGTGTLAPAMARYATCDGEITRLITGPASRPLDLGQAKRVVSLALRRALDVRDRGCIIPGCDRPAGWCHAHHITHWADGGDTAIENLALLCQTHHTELHLGHWHITMHNGTPQATFVPPHQRAQYRRQQREAQSNRPATTPRRT